MGLKGAYEMSSAGVMSAHWQTCPLARWRLWNVMRASQELSCLLLADFDIRACVISLATCATSSPRLTAGARSAAARAPASVLLRRRCRLLFHIALPAPLVSPAPHVTLLAVRLAAARPGRLQSVQPRAAFACTAITTSMSPACIACIHVDFRV